MSDAERFRPSLDSLDLEPGGKITFADELLARGFVQVPAQVFFDPQLKSGAKVIYGALCWWGWRHEGRAPGQEAMAEALGMGPTMLRQHLKQLQDEGYIEVEQLGLGRTNNYTLLKV